MTIEVHYRQGHPAGYTDDLGIISNRNQWVEYQPAGWYIYLSHHSWSEVKEWLHENNIYWDERKTA